MCGKIWFSVIGVTALMIRTLHAKRQTFLECQTEITICTNFDIYLKISRLNCELFPSKNVKNIEPGGRNRENSIKNSLQKAIQALVRSDTRRYAARVRISDSCLKKSPSVTCT